jgi:hypothetical protein
MDRQRFRQMGGGVWWCDGGRLRKSSPPPLPSKFRPLFSRNGGGLPHVNTFRRNLSERKTILFRSVVDIERSFRIFLAWPRHPPQPAQPRLAHKRTASPYPSKGHQPSRKSPLQWERLQTDTPTASRLRWKSSASK